MSDAGMSHDELVEQLALLAQDSLHLWDLPEGSTTMLINLSENATYRVDKPGFDQPDILRVHREGYHSENAIGCELAWMKALREDAGVITPTGIAGKDGKLIQSHEIEGLRAPRHLVLFEFIEGIEPDENQDLILPFENLGEVSAKLHLHVLNWQLPDNFERLTWDFEHMLGGTPNWGDWREAPAMDPDTKAVLERLAATIDRRLKAFGKGRERYGLVHADIRLANLLIVDDSTRVIDFDDCGFGWFLYDVATALSFIEDHPKVLDLVDAWVRGYKRIRDLPAEDEAEIPTFIMLRRMVLLAWIGSHGDTDLAKEQGPEFTKVSADLAETYLRKFG
ncbi:MAG: phosphotransferase enzyme family protein [Geminicoccaceae bacterium]